MKITRKALITGYSGTAYFITRCAPHLFVGSNMIMVRRTLTIIVNKDSFTLIYRKDRFSKFTSKTLPYGSYG